MVGLVIEPGAVACFLKIGQSRSLFVYLRQSEEIVLVTQKMFTAFLRSFSLGLTDCVDIHHRYYLFTFTYSFIAKVRTCYWNDSLLILEQFFRKVNNY